MIITDHELDRFLHEDVPYGDLTTRSLGLSTRPARMVFRAGAAMTVCCTEEAARILTRQGCRVDDVAASGAALAAGDQMLTATGQAEAIFAGWKVAQTLVEYASGISSAAARIAAAARAVRPEVVVACTRKNFPGTKAVAVKAILAGGAVPHRLGLSDTLLVFPEHRAFLGVDALAESISRLKLACPEKKVVVEVTSIEAAETAAQAGADVVQTEKFTPDQVAATVARLAAVDVLVAAAGGVNAANAGDYARAGARILVSSAPYSAPPVDVKVTIAPLG